MLSLRRTIDGAPILSGSDGVTLSVVPISGATVYVTTRGDAPCGLFRVTHREGAWRLVRNDGLDLPYEAACRCGWKASIVDADRAAA